jgi:acyl-CoA synthetase (AMP-forming)/AMP-acid ligase II/acyl carrier protein
MANTTWNVPDGTIASLLKKRAEQTPKAVAVVAPDRTPLTFERLYQQVQDTCKTLLNGLGRNDRIAIVLPNGPEMATAVLSVASCATCAPLNPNYQTKEFEFYLTDLKAKALILAKNDDSPARKVAQVLKMPIFELESTPENEAGLFTLSSDQSPSPVNGEFAQPDDIALVLHTSGTTSRPKLVPLTHINLCTSAHNILNTLLLDDKDRCLNIMPLFHIHGLVAALLSSLTAGGSIACTPGFVEDKFFEWLDVLQPTWYTAVPTMHQVILSHAKSNRDIIKRHPLRFIRSSSAALPPPVMSQLEKEFNCPVIEAYGMTEAAHQMASNPLPPKERKARSVGLGAGTEVAIMNEAGDLLAPGQTGEIVIKGLNVINGYENNPAANAAAFTNNWFRTGDQGIMDADGYLFITGRIKEMINRGGEKISPREIDEVLLEHPDITQAVAFAVPHPSLGEDVATAVVLRENASLTEQMIREFAFQRLADFKVPSEVVIVDDIPKGATGKLQRIGLAEKLADKRRRDYVAPRNDIELLIADIWAEILEIKPPGIHDNFFMLGGDSIRATRIISQLRALFQVNMPITTLFRKPTVAELSEELAASMDADELSAISELIAELDEMSEQEAQRLLDTELGRN